MRTAIAIATLLATTAAARAGGHELSIGTSTRALRTASANAVTAESLEGGALAYAHHLDLPLVPGLELWAQGTMAWGSADGTMFQTMSTELDTLAFSAGGRARYALHARVAASGRLELGLARTSLAIRDDHGHTAADRGWSATSTAAVGLDLVAIRGRRFSLGLRTELGVVGDAGVDLVATPESDSDGTLKLEMVAAGLGTLNLSGTMFSATLVGEF